MRFRNVWKLTRRPLMYLYRPNFPRFVVKGLPKVVRVDREREYLRLATDTTAVGVEFVKQS